MTLRVVFHIDDLLYWDRLLTNVRNFLSETEATIEVVANGPAVSGYAEPDAQRLRLIRQLTDQGVHFVACANALRAQKMDATALPEGVSVVASGVVELALRQQAGYAYIKP